MREAALIILRRVDKKAARWRYPRAAADDAAT
jgi:hypothetical protein